MTYKLYKTTNGVDAAIKNNDDGSTTSFLFYQTNTDYQTFKKEVLAGVELQDVDGNVISQEQADEFIKELP
jgi:hypothetical protein